MAAASTPSCTSGSPVHVILSYYPVPCPGHCHMTSVSVSLFETVVTVWSKRFIVSCQAHIWCSKEKKRKKERKERKRDHCTMREWRKWNTRKASLRGVAPRPPLLGCMTSAWFSGAWGTQVLWGILFPCGCSLDTALARHCASPGSWLHARGHSANNSGVNAVSMIDWDRACLHISKHKLWLHH